MIYDKNHTDIHCDNCDVLNELKGTNYINFLTYLWTRMIKHILI